jgi:transcriptional regulator with XRE-family HTH domain
MPAMVGSDMVWMARRRAGLTQRELAGRLGVPASTVARWESGAHAPSMEAVWAMARACGLELVVGLANGDDSYARDVAARRRLTPTERVRSLAVPGAPDPLAIAAALADVEVRCVLIGDVAGAAHGWPITLARGEYLVVAEEGRRNLERLAAAAESLGAGPQELEDPFAGRDVTIRWPLEGGSLAVATQLSGTRGYRDVQRASRPVALEQAVVQVAALRDLIRIADASPRQERRVFLPALWATLEQAEQAQTQPQTKARAA